MAMIHEITPGLKHKRKQRKGRGEGSKGKTAGKGTKGAKSRLGSHQRVGHEGGQTELARRFGKRGFSNHDFETRFHIVNLSSLEKKFDDGATVDADALIAAGLVDDKKQGVKILGNGELTKKLTVHAHKVSSGATGKIESAGGSVTIIPAVGRRAKGVKKGEGEAVPAGGQSQETPSADTPAAPESAATTEPAAAPPAAEQ